MNKPALFITMQLTEKLVNPMRSQTGSRLAKILAVDTCQFRLRFEFAALLDFHPRKAGRPDTNELAQASLAYSTLVESGKLDNRKTILVGSNVGKVVGLKAYETLVDGSRFLACIPSPAGNSTRLTFTGRERLQAWIWELLRNELCTLKSRSI